ncbi:hypothetical protein ROI_35180 [Roseburia intestinalis M50/1]|nr:hypothetical protein ROI_35180 [Roseburia intestinalis M50/1]
MEKENKMGQEKKVQRNRSSV